MGSEDKYICLKCNEEMEEEVILEIVGIKCYGGMPIEITGESIGYRCPICGNGFKIVEEYHG